MATRRDRKKFCNPLDDTEDNGLNDGHVRAGGVVGSGSKPLASPHYPILLNIEILNSIPAPICNLTHKRLVTVNHLHCVPSHL